MLLSDRDIRRRMAEGDLRLDPLDEPERQIQPASVDLRLGREFYEFDGAADRTIDPATDDTLEYATAVECDPGDTYELASGELVLGTTLEVVDLPPDIAGILIGRSSLGRLGVVPYTGAGFVDPGFEGELTLAFTNQGPFDVVLHPGEMRIVQLYLVSLTSAAADPYGRRSGSKYQNQRGPEQSRLREDWVDENE